MLEITPDDIAALADDDLRALVAHLCEAEVRKHNLSAAAVTWGGHQDATDGGIDVRVDLPIETKISGFIPRATTGFQVKKPDMPAHAITNEMLSNGRLRPSIEALASKNGSYIIVSSTGSVSDIALMDRRRAMADAVSNCASAGNLALDFYDRTRIASWVREHPGLVPWARSKAGRHIAGWQSFGSWASPQEAPDAEFIVDDAVRIRRPIDHDDGLTATTGIVLMREVLSQAGSSTRLVGLSGVGKTRLVQALFDSRVCDKSLDPALALYANTSDGPDPVPVGMVSYLVVAKMRSIVVVDNCPPDLHRRLTEVCKGSSVSVLSLEYDIREDQPEGTEVFILEPSSLEITEKVLRRQFQRLSEIDTRRVADFAGGNFRMALALARTVGNGEGISGLTDDQLFERLFHQRQAPDHSLLQAGEVCSLLYSSDVDTESVDSELALLGSLVDQSAAQLYANVAELQRRDLVQARSHWRAVLPHGIANRLAARALKNIPISNIEARLATNAPVRVKRSFSRRLGYLHDNADARRMVERMLAPKGLLSTQMAWDALHIEMLANVAPVEPGEVLRVLETQVASPNQTSFSYEDHKLIRLLRSLAYDPIYFDRCSNLLVDLAIEDPDQDNCQATSALKSMFFAFLSGTHATIEQRIGVMEDLVCSLDSKKQRLGLELLKALLESWRFSSAYEFEFGSRSRDYGYNPTFVQLKTWFARVVQSVQRLASLDLPGVAEVPGVLASAFRDLWVRVHIYDDLENVTRAFASKGYWREGWIAVRQTLSSYRTDDATAQRRARLVSLENELRPADLVQKVRSVVLSSRGFSVRLGDYEDDDENPTIAYERTETMAKELGEQTINDEHSLTILLPELLSGSGKLDSFGLGAGSTTREPAKHWQMLKEGIAALSAEKRSMQFLVGFLAGLDSKNPEMAASLLDDAVFDPILGSHFPTLQCAVSIGESGVRRLRESLTLGLASI